MVHFGRKTRSIFFENQSPISNIAHGNMATLDSDIGRFSLEEVMFLSQPLLEVLAGRSMEDIDVFLKVPSWNDLPDPFLIPSMDVATARVLRGIRNRDRITIHGDYDCDGVLGAHILRSVLSALGAPARTFLPHRDEGYGLSLSAVHRFSCSGTDLLITVDNGINPGCSSIGATARDRRRRDRPLPQIFDVKFPRRAQSSNCGR